jgi:hypothetical protein
MTLWAPLANDVVAEEDHPVIHVGDMGLLHIQREFERPFQKRPVRFAYRLSMRAGSFNDHDKIICIAQLAKRSTLRQFHWPIGLYLFVFRMNRIRYTLDGGSHPYKMIKRLKHYICVAVF